MYTRAGLKLWVKQQLGYPIIDIELDDTQFETAITDALEWLSSKACIDLQEGQFTTTLSTQNYTLPGLTLNGFGVVEVQPDIYANATQDYYEMYNMYLMSTLSSRNITDLMMLRMYSEEIRRQLGYDFAWRYDGYTSELFISPPPETAYNVYYWYAMILTVERVPNEQIDLLKNKALANTKRMLGTLRRFIKKVPGHSQDLELDGNELLTDADKLDEFCESELNSRYASAVVPLFA